MKLSLSTVHSLFFSDKTVVIHFLIGVFKILSLCCALKLSKAFLKERQGCPFLWAWDNLEMPLEVTLESTAEDIDGNGREIEGN